MIIIVLMRECDRRLMGPDGEEVNDDFRMRLMFLCGGDGVVKLFDVIVNNRDGPKSGLFFKFTESTSQVVGVLGVSVTFWHAPVLASAMTEDEDCLVFLSIANDACGAA